MTRHSLRLAWAGAAAWLLSAAGVLVGFRHRFDYALDLIDIPAMQLAIGLAVAGLVVLPLPWLIARTETIAPELTRSLLAFVVAIGLLARVILFVTEPALEDDYNRYLWDGAVTAHGFNPFAVAPATALEEAEETALGRLSIDGGVVPQRINHPDLKTIYPPVAQGAFAVAHLLAPWRLNGWRLVCLTGEIATLALLLALLGATGRSPLWVAIYWWNPLIIKEMINSAHMEAILMPLVLAALLLAVRRRPVAAAGMLGIAAGAKLWPVLLAPLLLRPLLAKPKALAAATALLATTLIASAIPPWLGGIDETSGFVAFANYWQTNNAFLPLLTTIVDRVTTTLGMSSLHSGLAARGLLGAIVAAVAVWAAWRPWHEPRDLVRRSGIVAIVLFLLSPAQFPWYAAWMMPFLVFRPLLPLLVLTALLPIYYASFHFLAREAYDTFRYGIVWLIWLPVWAGLATTVLRRPSVHA